PRPVTTTIGRPDLSLPVVITCSPSADLFDQRETFAAPMADAGHHDLAQVTVHWLFQPGRVTGRKETTMADRGRSQRDVHRELRLQPMPQIGTGGADGKVAVAIQELALFAGCRIDAGGAGQHGGVPGFDLVLDLVPQLAEACAKG